MKNKSTTILIVTIATCLIVVAILALSLGWIDFSAGKVKLSDYTTIPVSEDAVEVTDEEIDDMLTQMAENYTSTEEVTEGTVKDGDTIIYDYSGVLAGETEPFDGGTATDQQLTLGSGTMIDGFEDGIIGHDVGETFEIGVMFPDEYSNAPELAGKVAIFTITIHSIVQEIETVIDDDWVKEYTQIVLPDETINTVDEFKAYLKNYLYKNRLHNEMMSYLISNVESVSYDSKTLSMLKGFAADSLSGYALSNEVTADEYAQALGYADSADYIVTQAKGYHLCQLINDQILADNNITYTDEELYQAFDKYIQDEGYTNYTVEGFKESMGETSYWIYVNCIFKRDLALTAIENRVVFTETAAAEEEEEEETVTAETTSNEVSTSTEEIQSSEMESVTESDAEINE